MQPCPRDRARLSRAATEFGADADAALLGCLAAWRRGANMLGEIRAELESAGRAGSLDGMDRGNYAAICLAAIG